MVRQPLTRDRILRAALRLVDEEGLEALSMRRLGAALDVEGMALYRHVGNKERLLEGVAELLLEQLELPETGAASWQDAWLALAGSYRRLAHAHPGAFRLLALSPVATAERFERAQVPVAILRDAGFDEQTARLAFGTLLSYADGHLLRELSGGDERAGEDADAAFEFGIRAILAGLAERLRAA
jgi:TetR/AcrR family transcriptional regulator, tetracycline repressor protein